MHFFVICCAFSRMIENLTGKDHEKSTSHFQTANVELIAMCHIGHMF